MMKTENGEIDVSEYRKKWGIDILLKNIWQWKNGMKYCAKRFLMTM